MSKEKMETYSVKCECGTCQMLRDSVAPSCGGCRHRHNEVVDLKSRLALAGVVEEAGKGTRSIIDALLVGRFIKHDMTEGQILHAHRQAKKWDDALTAYEKGVGDAALEHSNSSESGDTMCKQGVGDGT